MITSAVPTRRKLIDAGLRLIAERGFAATTVGDIEQTVGLVPRSGGLYKHFPSKQALVEAALQERIDQITTMRELISQTQQLDRREALWLVGRSAFDELDREQHVVRVVEKDGDRFPEVRDRMRREMVEPGYRYTEAVLQHWLAQAGSAAEGPATDAAALSAVLLGSLVNHRRQRWLLGRPPHDIDDERFLAAWVELALLLFPEEET